MNIEICTNSYQSAINAQKAGASRIVKKSTARSFHSCDGFDPAKKW